MSEELAVAVSRRYQMRIRQLTTQAETALATVWDELGSWDQADVDRFAERATPLTDGAQKAATTLTLGYLGLLLAAAVPLVDPADFADLVNPLTPFLAYWSALGNGKPWAEAITAGRTTAAAVGNTAVQGAARGTSQQVDEQERRIVGWERVLVGPSCEWCALVATQRYHTFESANFGHGHGGVDYCDCGIWPIIGTTNPGRVVNRDLLDTLKNRDESSAYVNPDGSAAPRPEPADIEEP